MIEAPPLSRPRAAVALGRCAMRTAAQLARGHLRSPPTHRGWALGFADGSTAAVYRETVLDRRAPTDPCVLVVTFRLRAVRSSRAHALFRAESLLNTVLFTGFPGFVSKLWLRHDQSGRYRGLYEWDGPTLAESYVRALWHVLALVSVPTSIHYAVLPGIGRDDLLANPELAAGIAPEEPTAWWRLAVTEPTNHGE